MDDKINTKIRLVSNLGKKSYLCIDMIQQTTFHLSAKRRGCHLVTQEILEHLPKPLPQVGMLNLFVQHTSCALSKRFIQDSQSFIDNAITRAPYNFNILGTVTRNSLNQHRIPKRDIEKKQYLLEALDEIQKNNIQIVALLKQPKYVSDPEKPTPKQI